MTDNVISIYEVFTPSSPAQLTFIERSSINEKLDRALRTQGKQIILYGHSGSGKTTIIHNRLSAFYKNKIVTRCTKSMTLDDVIMDAFDQLDIYFKEGSENLDGSKIGGKLAASFLGIKASLNAEANGHSKESLKRIIAVQLTPPTLAKFIGSSGCCWVIEDFHKIIARDKESFSQILKVFMDMAVDYPKLKIITIGAVNTAREIIQYDREMKNRVAEINVPLMDTEKLTGILEKGEKLLNIKFDEIVKSKIASLSCGLPSVTHNLALLICERSGLHERRKNDRQHIFNQADLKKAMDEFIADNEDTYKAMFEKATYCKYARQWEHPKELLFAMIDSGKEEAGIADIVLILKSKNGNYKSNNLKQYLEELTLVDRDEVLRYHKGSNTYHFSNPFFKSYVSAKQYEELQNVTLTKIKIVRRMSKYLNELSLGKQQFLRDFENFEDEFADTYDEQPDEYEE